MKLSLRWYSTTLQDGTRNQREGFGLQVTKPLNPKPSTLNPKPGFRTCSFIPFFHERQEPNSRVVAIVGRVGTLSINTNIYIYIYI